MRDRTSITKAFILMNLVFILAFPLFSSHLNADSRYWPMIGYNASHTGFNSNETQLAPPFPVEIIYQAGPDINGLSAQSGSIFVTCRSDTNELRMLDILSGSIPWTFPIQGSNGASNNVPAIWDTLVFVGGQSGTHLHCINRNTGGEIWSYPTGSLDMRHTTVDAGRVYVNTEDSLLCLDVETGLLLWGTEAGTSPTPAIKGNTLYAYVDGGMLTAFDKTNGDVQWEVDHPVPRCVLVAGDSLLYFRAGWNALGAVRQSDGSEKWLSVLVEGSIADLNTGCLAFAYGKLFVSIWDNSDYQGQIHALNTATGLPDWVYTFPAEGASTPVVANHVVYVNNWTDNRLYALDVNTGDTLQTFPDKKFMCIVSDGSLILTGNDSDIHIFRMEPLRISEDEIAPHVPEAVLLSQNYPNPFNPTTTISFDIPGEAGKKQRVTLTVYDLHGHHLKTLIDTDLEPGRHTVMWDGRNEEGREVSSGIYLYTLKNEHTSCTRKMVILE